MGNGGKFIDALAKSLWLSARELGCDEIRGTADNREGQAERAEA
jgi:hypothetical protein